MEYNVRYVVDNSKRNNLQIIGVLEKEVKGKREECLSEEIIIKYVPDICWEAPAKEAQSEQTI